MQSDMVFRRRLSDEQSAETSLNEEQADYLLEHSARLRSLKQVQDLFKDMGGALGVPLMVIVFRVMQIERK